MSNNNKTIIQETNQYLLQINKEAFFYLLSIYRNDYSKGKLIFPRKSKLRTKSVTNGSYRISEQELRFAVTKIIEHEDNNNDIYYGIEYPTKEDYSFKGYGKRAAMSDLVLFKNVDKKLTEIAIIEMKANNPQIGSITKDIEKLLEENHTAKSEIVSAWIHIFDNQNKETIITLINKIKTSISITLNRKFSNHNNEDNNFFIAIHILKTGHLLTLQSSISNILKNPDILDFNYKDIQKLNTGKSKVTANNWTIYAAYHT